MGRYKEAQKSALPLFAIAPRLIAITAATAPASLNGSLEKSRQLLAKVLKEEPESPLEMRVWALGSLAEMAVRAGDHSVADRLFEEAHQLDRRNPWLTRTFANHLLATDRPELVERLLEGRESFYQLHWLLATESKQKTLPEWPEKLTNYEKSLTSSDHGHAHGREAARFLLDLKESYRPALHAISAEVRTQREPDDLLIALRCAIAAEDEVLQQDLSDWIRKKNLEDVRLLPLLSPDLSKPE